MNRQEKIEFIYEKIADKTLSFGCKIRIHNAYLYTDNKQYEDYFWSRNVKCIIEWKYAFENEHNFSKMEISNISFYEKFDFDMKISDDVIRLFEFYKEDEDLKIIGHPVMLGDVLDYLWDKKWLMTIDRIIRHWEKKRLPIEDQDDGFIDYIYRTLQ